MTAVSVYSEVTGRPDAPALVLSGSLGTDLTIWDPVVPHLADDFRVIRYDHRGHGRSPVPPGPYTIDDLGSDVIAMLDTLGVGRAHVAGVSLGGMVGLWLAAQAPERVAGLVAMCTSAHLEPHSVWAERARLVEEQGTGAVADTLMGRWFTPRFREERPQVVADVRRSLLATSARGYAACCRAIESMDLRPLLPLVETDVLVVAAADDPATPRPHAELIASAVPRGRVRDVPGAHLACVETPELIAEIVLGHLGRASRAEVGT